ncbi:MAG: 30S ribosomal protein S20 [Actinobacteria bacterium]|nr:30S ribosomal protein S20 [Actinomycetota bacterium]|tara:strand:+ start:4593 stop:4853 length:261 start_codon:yes stop_codon:yes gene_type:complete
MANIKSQIKRNRQNEKRRARNKAIRSEVNSRVKSTLNSAESGESDEEALRIAIKKIDKAARKNILHKNTAARKKSRLTKRYNDLTS